MLSALRPRSFDVESMSTLSRSSRLANSFDLNRDVGLPSISSGISTVGADSGPNTAVLIASFPESSSATNDASNSRSSSVRSRSRSFNPVCSVDVLSRECFSASAIMRRERSSRPATMVGASVG